ncbi:putative spore germination protein YfkR [Collibacillus ludicampi]|uniref:Spore germination protein YfkR n=1 Tax=Collibacillus ludicampi TaxID=2771369 RepID=A0AAV4LHG9_9BACL|nr:Ger(x)C family spore germination protein [Collibacillus ludicampi]GIM47134.1 putative spore germination protein YfkR [Collibacillus ludicampi]
MTRWRLIGLILISLSLTGCWDRIETSDLALVMATAIDEGADGRVEVSTQLALPAKMGGLTGQGGAASGVGKDAFTVVSAQGRDIVDANQKMQKKLSRRLFQSHRRVIIFGERLARKGVKEVLDGLTRDPENRLRTFVLVAKGIEGKELLKVSYPFEFVPSEAIREMERSNVGLNVTLRDFLIMNETGSDSYMGVIEDQEKEKTNHSTGDKKYFRVNGSALFHDQKLVDFLSDEETRGLKAITGRYKHGFITLSFPGGTENVTISVLSMKTKLEPVIRGDRLVMRVRVKSEGDIHENDTRYDMADPKVIKIVEQMVEKEIEQRFMRTVRHVQNKHLDVLGFGEAIHRKDPERWKSLKKDWNQRFSQMEVKIDVSSKIWRTGQSGPPVHYKKQEVNKK